MALSVALGLAACSCASCWSTQAWCVGEETAALVCAVSQVEMDEVVRAVISESVGPKVAWVRKRAASALERVGVEDEEDELEEFEPPDILAVPPPPLPQAVNPATSATASAVCRIVLCPSLCLVLRIMS